MIKSGINIFLIFSIFIGAIFVVTTFFSKKGRDKSIIYLNLVVFFLTLNYLQIVLLDNVFNEANYFVKILRLPFYAFILPSYYTFVTYYLNVQKKIKSYVIISIVLFSIEIFIRGILFHFFYDKGENYIVAKYRQIEEIINISFSFFLFIKAFLLLFNQSKLYQYILKFDNVKWLQRFMYLGSIILLSWLFAVVFNLNKIINPVVFVYYPLRIGVSILIFWLGYEGLFNYKLLSERIEIRKSISRNEINKRKASTSKNDLNKDKFSIIQNHIADNFNFLDPNFSLEILSSELKMSISSLSTIINKESGYNFSDYINSMRVEKAKEYLILEEFKDYTILAIGLECGFNSKSTFYSSFKKFVGCTPSEYRTRNFIIE